ncbi:hypothetical protein [Egibacter rhizosphaerae]|uniref:hypothetical protein n=1 Tax=Egibacter rhizosphaerae TaxID=1670831 RepID=UPI0013F1534D|nr:hypothetical protein [Egibacter rhizosphaerae]
MSAELLYAHAPVCLPADGPTTALWEALVDLADARPDGWTLIGALMVSLHEHEARQPSARLTADADAVVDVRGATSGPRTLAETLLGQGWQLYDADVDINQVGYIFRRGDLAFDLTVYALVGRALADVLQPQPRGLEGHAVVSVDLADVAYPIPRRRRGRWHPRPGMRQPVQEPLQHVQLEQLIGRASLPAGQVAQVVVHAAGGGIAARLRTHACNTSRASAAGVAHRNARAVLMTSPAAARRCPSKCRNAP